MTKLPLTAGAAAAALLAATTAFAEEEAVVNVYNWSDYIDEEILTEFEAETGIKVVYDVFDSNNILETKLLTGSTGYDVVVPAGLSSRARSRRASSGSSTRASSPTSATWTRRS